MDIDKLICKRAIRRLNKEISKSYLYCGDNYPDMFNTFDILAIEIQSMFIDEINPLLDDYIHSILDDEAEKSKCKSDDLYKVFRNMLDEHFYIKKIQNFVDKW